MADNKSDKMFNIQRAVHIFIIGNKPDVKIEGKFTVAELIQLSKYLEQYVLSQEVVQDVSNNK